MKFVSLMVLTMLTAIMPVSGAEPTIVNGPNGVGVLVDDAVVVQNCSAMTHCTRYGYIYIEGGVLVDPSLGPEPRWYPVVGSVGGAASAGGQYVPINTVYIRVGPGPEPPPSCGFTCPVNMVQWVLDQLP